MREGYRTYKGKNYPDPGGSVIVPRRAFLEDPLLAKKPWHQWIFWQYIVYLAVWDRRGRKVRLGNDVVHLERGQFYHSLRWIGRVPGMSKDTVARELARLAKEGRITAEARHDGTVVTIVNYDPYQDPSFYAETRSRGLQKDYSQNRDAKRDTNRDEDNPTTDEELGAEIYPPARHEPRRDPRRTRDAPETVLMNQGNQENENARARGQTPKVASPRQDTNPAPTTWQQIRGANRTGIWNSIPPQVRTTMLTQALESGPAPADIRTFVAREANTLGITITDDTTAEEELRAKLEKLRNGGRT